MLFRIVQIVTASTWETFKFLFKSSWHPEKIATSNVQQNIAHIFVRICEKLGGAFPKFGQILSTRADILPLEVLNILCVLQDKVSQLPKTTITREIEAWRHHHAIDNLLIEWDSLPLAAGTIAQVHKAILWNGTEVALKIRRPSVHNVLAKDTQILIVIGRLFTNLSLFHNIPIKEVLDQICHALVLQSDFQQEANNHKYLSKAFSDSLNVDIPKLFEELCTETVLCLEFIPDAVRISDRSLDRPTARKALLNGLHALYRMIFIEGLIHCDLHPGNLLAKHDGSIVILDTGFVTKISDEIRINFANFFLSIIMKDGLETARILRETAFYISHEFEKTNFDKAVCDLVNQWGGVSAEEFNVIRFVESLFLVQRNFGVCSSPHFTLIIIALLVYEGVVKQISPDLEFQSEALPFVMAAIAGMPS
ncbi:ABC1 kinase family protein [Allocoleopsis sp.]|uniref:ABC1 kinase family protein n=1 Tax=Allocoleopsis sp. TaxID=3088169 RepID=UPI002FD6FC43